MDWEAWLRAAAKRPSDHEDDKRDQTEEQIRVALSGYEKLRGKYVTYAKGSYANNTNVRLNYDVDIAVEYTGYFYSDLCFSLEGHDKSEVGVISTEDTYTRADFKKDIVAALRLSFGAPAVEVGRIAYRIRKGKTTLPADVVPSWEYRRYDSIDRYGQPIVNIGSRVYPSDGSYVNNFPKIQVVKGTEKNCRTKKRYKRMVRCLKKLQTRLKAQSKIAKELPSYLIECIVFNVPDDRFGNDSYLRDFRNVVGYIWKQTEVDGNWDTWTEVHGLKYLFKGDRSWTREEVHDLALMAWSEVGIA
jgi:hypothetical protein